jgi:ribonucleotide reductase alpha subunit
LTQANFICLRESVGEIILNNNLDLNEAWLYFKEKFMEAQALYIPMKKMKAKKNNPKWFNNNIKNAILERNKAYKLDKSVEENYNNYIYLRRKVKSLVNKAKINETFRISQLVKTNPKEFYKHVSNRNPVKSHIGPIRDLDGILQNDDNVKASLFNMYFSSVYTVENLEHIPEPKLIYNGDACLENIICTRADMQLV